MRWRVVAQPALPISLRLAERHATILHTTRAPSCSLSTPGGTSHVLRPRLCLNPWPCTAHAGKTKHSAPNAHISVWLHACTIALQLLTGLAAPGLACVPFGRYTHGALLSGRENAAAYLFEAGKGPDPAKIDALQLCTL